MPSHLEESLQRGIDLIRSKVIEMGGQVERALQASLTALMEGNRQIAYSVILRDQQIDELENELDRLCLEFLVRQQPVAGHLRFVYAAIKINNELERIGDYAESIARQYLAISSLDIRPLLDKFQAIADRAIPMLHDAIKSFVDQNPELARKTLEMEGTVDQIRDAIHSELVNKRQEKKFPLGALAPLMIMASRFERVADQACNICEEVLYMCTGESIRHKGTEVFRIVFVDQHGSCLSQMAEGIGNNLGLAKFLFASAGVEPGPLDPRTVRFMADKGIDISRQTSKGVLQIPNLEHYQVIVALSKGAEEVLPPPPTKTVGLSWKIDDPSKIPGDEARASFEKAFEFLDVHIRDVVQAVLGDERLKGGI
jgi:phosphate transport system protein